MFTFLKRLFTPKDYFYKHDLNVWQYLGCSEISFVNEMDMKTHGCYVFFFEHKESGKRSFYAQFNDSYEKIKFNRSHHFFTKHAPIWKAGETDLFHHIHEPSIYLRQYMESRYNWVWDANDGWWKSKPKKTHTADNVITVEFSK